MNESERKALLDASRTNPSGVRHALKERRKGNYEPAIKLGIMKKNMSPRSKLIQLSKQWQHIFKEPLPLLYPVWTKQIPMIKRCIKKKDPTEMKKWLEQKNKEKKEKGHLW